MQVNNISFTGKWNIFDLFGKKHATNIILIQKPDTFIRTIPPCHIDFNNIKAEKFISAGREANIYKTNNENYVLRITKKAKYIPEEMIPVQDGNGLILATNKNNTVQLLKYVKGEPLYGKDWNIVWSNLNKDEFLEAFNKIKELPDESFAQYIKNIIHIRKSGYEIDTLCPNNVLLDGTNLNIVDIEKSPGAKPEIFMTDFYCLVDAFHTKEMMFAMNKEERYKFAKDTEILFDRIIAIAEKEGLYLKKSLPFPKEYTIPHD